MSNKKITRLTSFTTTLIMTFLLIQGCAGGTNISTEVAESLVRINVEAMERIESEVEQLDNDLKNATMNLAKFENVAKPALEWAELQEPDRYSKGTWVTDVIPQNLTQFKNDSYEIVVLQYVAQDVGGENESFYPLIKIKDLTTNAIYDWDLLDSQLRNEVSTLTNQRESKLQRQHQSASVLANILTSQNEWKAKKTSDSRYTISGLSLGIPGTGVWIYNSQSKVITPDNGDAETLKKVLAAES